MEERLSVGMNRAQPSADVASPSLVAQVCRVQHNCMASATTQPLFMKGISFGLASSYIRESDQQQFTMSLQSYGLHALRVQEVDTADDSIRQHNAALQKRVDQLQTELGDAKQSLEYMNQLLVALKAHKKATAAAKTALETLRRQLSERDEEIAALQDDKAKLQGATQALKAELEESEMSAVHAIAGAEESRKQQMAVIRQLEQQQQSEIVNIEQRHGIIIEQWTQALSDVNLRASQAIVTAMVLRAINKVKTDEALRMRACIAESQAEALSTSEVNASKSHEIELLKQCISDRDVQIETLRQCQSSDNSEKEKLLELVKAHEDGKHEIQRALTEAQDSYKLLEAAKHEMMEHGKAAVQALEQDNAMLHGRLAATRLQARMPDERPTALIIVTDMEW